MAKTKQLTLTAMFLALSITLPFAFHGVANAGSIFLPMHIPVLLCGIICGWPYGLACGILGPLLSSLSTGMPPAAYLPSMVCELAVYGMVAGMLTRKMRTGKKVFDLYLPLVCAMLSGRVCYGILNALIFKAGSYSLTVWLTGAFITSLPGIVMQLILIPALLYVLEEAGLMELDESYFYKKKG